MLNERFYDDIPGIIEGASDGKGLGLQFLRHIERTKILLLLIDITSEDIQKEYDTLLNELEAYSPELSKREKIVALSKADLLDEDEQKDVTSKKLNNYEGQIFVFSSVSDFGVKNILDYLWQRIND